MSLEKLISLMSRLFFLGAFALFVLAVTERIANTAGYTILRLYSGGRLLEFAVVLLIFVIAIQLREIKEELKSKTLGN
jgi:preprotein translocase subunit SecY